MHLFGITLEESSTACKDNNSATVLFYLLPTLQCRGGSREGKQRRLTSVKQCVSREDDLVIAILHKPTDAILGMAWRIETLYGDAANAPWLAVSGRLCDGLAVLATDDGKIGRAELSQLLTPICIRCVPNYQSSDLLTSFLFPPAWSQWLKTDASACDLDYREMHGRDGLLMRVDNCCEVDLASFDSLLQDGSNPTKKTQPSTAKLAAVYQVHNANKKEITFTARLLSFWVPGYSLIGIRRIDNHSVLRLVIRDQIRIVITRPRPCSNYNVSFGGIFEGSAHMRLFSSGVLLNHSLS